MLESTERQEHRAIRSIAVWEIVSIFISCLIAEWVMLAFFNRNRLLVLVPILFAVVQIAVSHRTYHESLRQLGFRLDNFFAAAKLLVVPTITAVLLVVLIGWLLGAGQRPSALRARLLLLPFWALFQQYVLQGYVNRRAEIAFGKGWKSVILVAAVFSLVHLPNPMLTVLTLAGGIIWATVYQSQPNLFALAISHTLASLSVSLALPLDLINGLRVGFKYFG